MPDLENSASLFGVAPCMHFVLFMAAMGGCVGVPSANSSSTLLTLRVVDEAGEPVPGVNLHPMCADERSLGRLPVEPLSFREGAYRGEITDCSAIHFGIVSAEGFKPYVARRTHDLSSSEFNSEIVLHPVAKGLRPATVVSLVLDDEIPSGSLGFCFSTMQSVALDSESVEFWSSLRPGGYPQFHVQEGMGIQGYSEAEIGETSNLAAPLIAPTSGYATTTGRATGGFWVKTSDGVYYRLVNGGRVAKGSLSTWSFSVVQEAADGTWAAPDP